MSAESPSGVDVQQLVKRADSLQLHTERYWHILMHYERTLLGVKSQVDDPNFFLASDGKHNARAELVATLHFFWGSKPPPDAVCRFPGRYKWLADQLGQSPQPCPALEQLIATIKPNAVSLVFPDAYINSPPSMFGHTLLNIRGKDDSTLLEKSVNYAARTQETSGLVFAVKGLLGMYPGYYDIYPYYARVQQYNDISQRDIWEYELNVSVDEVHRLIRHVWELQNIYSDYFFFDDNCSYNLLYLLEAARPDVELTEQFRYYAIPLDTIRAVQDAGLVRNRRYRPSRASVIRALADSLPPKRHDVARALATGTITSDATSVDMDARTLELSTRLLQYDYSQKRIEKSDYRTRLLALLRARSQFGDRPELEVTEPEAPDSGHRSGRLGLGADFIDGRFYQRLSLRPAYHDLLDPEAGRPNGSDIEFGHIQLHIDPADDKVELNRITAIGIVSLAARDRLFRPVSWKFKTGVDNSWFHRRERHHLFFLNPGRGFTWSVPGGNIYGLLEADGLAGGGLNDNHSLGAGTHLGWLSTPTSRLRCHLFFRALHYPIGHRHERLTAALGIRWLLSTNATLRVDLHREQLFRHTHERLGMMIQWFF